MLNPPHLPRPDAGLKIHRALPFSLGAPSMVFGHDLVQNVQILAEMVDDVELVLFHTPTLHNMPERDEIQILRRLGKEHGLTYSVHLPTALDPASPVPGHRTDSLLLARKIILRMMELDPQYFILHLPLTPPTLVFQPGSYYAQKDPGPDDPWLSHAFEFLREIGTLMGNPEKLLVENINYTPSFLDPFLHEGLCRLCLDLGHLELGAEPVVEQLNRYIDVTRIIHLHGVVESEEHISLSRMPRTRTDAWLQGIRNLSYAGVLTLEVFSPQDLAESRLVVLEKFRPVPSALESDTDGHG